MRKTQQWRQKQTFIDDDEVLYKKFIMCTVPKTTEQEGRNEGLSLNRGVQSGKEELIFLN